MPARELPARPSLEQYRKQAKDRLKQWKSADAKTTRKLADAQFEIAREHGFDTWTAFTERIARLTGEAQKTDIWRAAEDAVVAGNDEALAGLLQAHEKMLRSERPRSSWHGGLAPNYADGDARAIIVREHFFENWPQFAHFADELKNAGSAVARFERAVDAVVSGDAGTLEHLLHDDPDLARARSMRTHHSMLLHYVGANGVESWRQRPSTNAVRIAGMLLDAGADIDATADMYNGGCTALGLAATSIHPKTAGVLPALIDLLLARGARIDAPGAGGGNARLMINSCLANGRPEAAEHLARRGATLDLEGAAGVGRLDLVKGFFDAAGVLKGHATVAQMNAGFTWACEYGRTDVVDYLLDHGVDVNVRTGPHEQTGLHWAATGGHLETVKAILRRRPNVDVRDTSFGGTPLGWALYGWWHQTDPLRKEPFYAIVSLLVAAGAPVEREWLNRDNAGQDPRMFAALGGLP